MTDCLFCKIAKGEIPVKPVYEDALAVAFNDLHPQAPIHQLIIPKQHIATINDLLPEHNAQIGHLYQIAQKLAKDHAIDKAGYRVVMNCNENGGQSVFHLHLHLLGGRPMAWPPG